VLKFNIGSDDSVPETFRYFAELQFVRNGGDDGGGEVDSEMEVGPLPSPTIDAEPHKRAQFSEGTEPQSWLVEDDIMESD
jgi:hypothetical protein